ncbi:MAG: hypothetical protein KTR25_10180 [Myxococcales bacterium]|nr:hypothetical protein [Myxococcales bacterium]
MLDVVLVSAASVTIGVIHLGNQERKRAREREAWYRACVEAQTRLPPSSGSRINRGIHGPVLRLANAGQELHVRAKIGQYAILESTLALPVDLAQASPRVWIGWDVWGKAPSNWGHVPRLSVISEGLRGRFLTYGDDLLATQHLIDRAFFDLTDVRRESQAHGVTLAIRSGYMQLTLYRCSVSSYGIERLVRASTLILQQWWQASPTLSP